jgi:hypothetical protein
VAAEAAGWDPELNDQDMGPILDEVEAGHCPEWKDIADLSLTYRSCWAQRKSLSVRNRILERHLESADGRPNIAQIILHRSRVNDVLI